MDKKLYAAAIRENIIKGLGLAFERLIDEKIKMDGELIFSINGKIIRIKASKLKKIKKLAPTAGHKT